MLESYGEALVFRENGVRIGTVPLAPLSRVYLRGEAILNSSLLAKLGAHGVAVIVLSGRKAEPTLMMPRPHNDAEKRISQYKASTDADFCLKFSRETVRNKIATQIQLLEEMKQSEPCHRYALSHSLEKINVMHDKAGSIPGIPQLMGLEGASSAAYFEGLASVFPPRLNFSQRNRRPPRDPVNAVLSLGYTLLHAEAVVALYGSGLDPYIGFYHQLDFGRESLACDIIESLRVFVDRHALNSFKSGLLRPEDFSITDQGCFMGKAARPKYYESWDVVAERIRHQLSAGCDELARQVREQFKQQVRAEAASSE